MSQTQSTSAPAGSAPESADGTVTGAALAARSAGTGPAPLIVDVRSAAEFEAVHIRGSYHVPLQTLAEHTAELAAHLTAADPVVLVCQSGVRAEQARRRLAGAGLAAARVLSGGVPAYAAAGGDIVRGRRRWALERQVRLVAGGLVLAGLGAGRYLSPRARLLAAGVGAGLTMSAVTDTCAMGAALARLPINRGIAEPTPAETFAALTARAGDGAGSS